MKVSVKLELGQPPDPKDPIFKKLRVFNGVVGLAFLAGCLTIRNLLLGRIAGAWAGLLRESLTIAGWVAMWRPVQIYLHDWWPLWRRGRVLSKLSTMPVEVIQKIPHPGQAVRAEGCK